MGVFNYYGLIIIILILIPNILFAIFNKNGFDNLYKNKVVEILEQIGRLGCFILMIVNIPHTYFGFWFKNAELFYIITNAVLVVAYCLIWGICFKKNSIFMALMLSILPSLLFLFSGIMIVNIPLIISSLIFSPTHILISFKNSKESNKKQKNF